MAEWVSELKVAVPPKTEASPIEFENGSNVSSSTDLELSPGAEPQDHRAHHLLKHCLSNTQKDGALQHFGCDDVKEAARDISRMGQRELQAKFKVVYGTSTHSNNNDWLRRKLYEAIGASPVKAASKPKARKPAPKARKGVAPIADACTSPTGSVASEARKRPARGHEAERKRLHTSLPATPLALHMQRRRGAGDASFASSSAGPAVTDEDDLLYYSTDVDTPRSEPIVPFHQLSALPGHSRPGSSAYHVQVSSRSLSHLPSHVLPPAVTPAPLYSLRPSDFAWPSQPIRRSYSLDPSLLPPPDPEPRADYPWTDVAWAADAASALDLDVEPLCLPSASSNALSSEQDDDVLLLQFSNLPGIEN